MLAAALGLGGVAAEIMPAAPAGAVETGVPSFVVLGPEALGLSTAPLDLHLLPDGRVLVVSQHELAFGDGVRWETFQGAGPQPPLLAMVAVDRDGGIYTGSPGGFARIDLGEGGRWHLTPTAKLPGEMSVQNSTMRGVAMLTDTWYWYGQDDAIISWRPDQPARLAGRVGVIDRIFTVGETVYVSNQSSGGLSRLKADGGAELVPGTSALVSESVTCATPFEPGLVLVGTGSVGLRLFDGKTFRPFGPPGVLNSGHRITDLCPTGEGFFAAAVDAVGLVFFDRAGHTVQVLDRSLDHRLARVQRLRYGRDGVLWALLNDGVARVEFPSPVSHFEPLLASGLSFAQPLRHAGRLWMLADGRAIRGIYDASGRLERFEDDTPQGRYLFTLAEIAGQLFASNDAGIFVYETTGWRMILPGIVNARIGVARPVGDGLFYVARGEYGMIQRTGQSYTARRIPVADLGDSYNSVVDAAGIGWIELGVSKVGRFDPHDGNPIFQILGTGHGLVSGWVELFLLDGIVRVHLADHHFRFDDAQQKFVEDRELVARIPEMAGAGGRPTTDSFDRLWFTANGAPRVIDRSANGGNRPVKSPPVGFAPTGYTAEADGVVWMFERGRLARMDLRLPQSPDSPLRALITSVQFSSSSRQLFAPGPALAPLDFADNSLVIHFAAPSNPFAAPITFEVLLEGAGAQWVSTGAVGLAAFHRLKEGDYVFRVRPVADGTARGAEARLQFTVRPPWFRTTLAWAIYAGASVSLVAFVTWFFSYLQRRENARLELLVAKRTGELNATNLQLGRQVQETTEKSTALAASEERYRSLNIELEDRVQRRTAELSVSHAELQQRESLFRLIFEHAPVGVSWKRADLGDGYHLNSTFRHILDLPADTLTDYTQLAALVHPADAPRHTAMNRRIATGETDRYTLEERFVLKGDRLVWGLLSVAVIRGDSGRIIQEIGILEDITARKTAEQELAATHRNLLDASRQAGMAEVATGVLHNVGNVLNSVNVSATLVADQVGNSRLPRLAMVCDLLREHAADLGAFLHDDPKGRHLPAFLDALASQLAAEHAAMTRELLSLRKNVDHIKDIVSMQQSYARISGVVDTVTLTDLVEDALRMNATALARHDVALVRDYQAQPTIELEKQKVLQILVNLIGNAKNACDESGRAGKLITVRTTSDGRSVRIAIIDNGVGIPAENLTRIFNHGFTTRKDGHGFGLHSGALAAKELGGSLTVQSDGPGHGATFILELPCQPTTPTLESPPAGKNRA